MRQRVRRRMRLIRIVRVGTAAQRPTGPSLQRDQSAKHCEAPASALAQRSGSLKRKNKKKPTVSNPKKETRSGSDLTNALIFACKVPKGATKGTAFFGSFAYTESAKHLALPVLLRAAYRLREALAVDLGNLEWASALALETCAQ